LLVPAVFHNRQNKRFLQVGPCPSNRYFSNPPENTTCKRYLYLSIGRSKVLSHMRNIDHSLEKHQACPERWPRKLTVSLPPFYDQPIQQQRTVTLRIGSQLHCTSCPVQRSSPPSILAPSSQLPCAARLRLRPLSYPGAFLFFFEAPSPIFTLRVIESNRSIQNNLPSFRDNPLLR
jgi:hypothetical protein